MRQRIVFLDRASIPSHIAIPKPALEHEWIEYDASSPENIAERVKDATVIIVNKVVIDRALIQQLPKLQHIAVIATGYNNVDVDTCREQGVGVSNTRGYASTSVPEHTIALIFALRRHLLQYQYSVREGEWQTSPHFHHYLSPTRDLANSQIGLIGSGELGQGTARLARALGMKVVFAERKGQTSPAGNSTPDRPDYLPFEELIRTSDIVSLHCPLTPETKDLIGTKEMQAMKSDALLINTARGGLINEADLTQAILEGTIAGAGLDVVEVEPIVADNPLLSIMDKPNFILTPHVAWSSDQAMQTQAQLMIDNIEAFAAGKSLSRVV